MWRALSYSARRLTQTPAASLAVLVAIALGIGSNATIDGFSRGLNTVAVPLHDVDSIVSVFAVDTQRSAGPVSFDDFVALQSPIGPFETVGAARESQVVVTLSNRSLVVTIAEVTPEFADLFGLSLDDGAIISHSFWQRELGARDVVGQTIRRESGEIPITSVGPDWLDGVYAGRPVDVWLPFREPSPTAVDQQREGFWVLARLRADVSRESSQETLHARPGMDALTVVPYTGLMPDMADGLSRISALLRAAAGALFLAAAANVASFVLAGASTRSQETALRVALGARRTHLLTQVGADSVLLSLSGGVLGLVLAVWTTDLVPGLFFEEDAERLFFAPDAARILVVTSACIALTFVCGLLPILSLRHDNAAAVLQRYNAGLPSAMRRMCDGLVSMQMAICGVLIIGTAITSHGLRSALETYDSHRLDQTLVLTAQAPARVGRLETADNGRMYFAEVERVAQSVSDVVETAWTSALPGSRPSWQSIRVEPPNLPFREGTLQFEPLTHAVLSQLTLPPVAGRMFGGADTEGCPSLVLDIEAAALMFDGDPVGRIIEDPSGQRSQIIGVVRRAPTITKPQSPTVYYDRERNPGAEPHAGLARFRVPVLPAHETHGVLSTNVVSPGYFSVLGLPPASGRLLPARAAAGCRTGVLNEEAAERYFPGAAIGGAVIDSSGLRTEIVGIVRSPRLRTAQRGIEPTLYLPMSQDFAPRSTLLVRMREVTAATLETFAIRANAVPGGAANITATTLDAYLVAGALAPERIAATLVGALTTIAFGLGLFGLYGSMSDAVRRRGREFALRIALGASGLRIATQVLAEGGRLAAAGTIAGILVGVAMARSISQMTPTDDPAPLWVWFAAPAILCCAVGLAAVVPAWRARRADPLTLMRDT